MTKTSARWLLAYDATCGTCRKISQVVRPASAGKLEVVPLDRPTVRAWRELALGPAAPWRPTLLRVAGDAVRAWTGPAMAGPLIRCLGPKSAVRVVYALGKLRADTMPARLFVGAIVAAGLLLTGRAPAAGAREKADAQRWVDEHRHQLPSSYDEILAYPQAYQVAIFAASPPAVQSRFWVEALKRDRASRDALSTAQEQVFDDAIELAATTEIFLPMEPDSAVGRRLTDLRERAITEFGSARSYVIFLKLGAVRGRAGHG
jgi:hypothetical protein